ncbi:MAG: hypothetical protein E5Y14_14985 [Mesorhizobium sp.]|nr:MAG: hypothetical protein E5Y14_14985 [Mesorhizobium sp.]
MACLLSAGRSLAGNPELRHWNVTWGLATSPDLRKWTYRGTVFRPSKTPSFHDLTIWTGCVVRKTGIHGPSSIPGHHALKRAKYNGSDALVAPI